MTGNTSRKDNERAASEVTRARRRAAFIATIRHASQVDMAAARPATRPVTALARRPAAPPATPEPQPASRAVSPEPAPALRTPSPGPKMRAVTQDARPEPVLGTRVEPWAERGAPAPRVDSRPERVRATMMEVWAPKWPAMRAEPVPPPPLVVEQDLQRGREIEPAEAPQPPKARPQVVQAPSAGQPKPGLFREEALRQRLSAEEGRGLVRVSPPWTWALLWIVVAGLGAAITASFVGEVEVTGRGRGIIRPTTGVRALTSQINGTVVRVDARSGDRVKAGANLLRIESAATQAQLLEAERELESVRTRFSAASTQQDQHYAEQTDSLKARSRRLLDQIASLRSSEKHFQRRVDADMGLLKKGLVSELAVSDTRDALAQAQRQLNGAEQALDQTRQELASLEARRQEELWQRQQTVSAAQNKRDALAVVMQQSVIQVPEDGIFDVFVRVGETVQAGQVVAKVVPVEAPLQVVSFLAEKDRAFAKSGDEVELELDQLPHSEYGTLKAKVIRIGDDLASQSEVRDALGDGQKLEAPAYRVELEITDAHAAEAAGVKLRTGTLLNARYTLRRQKPITMVLNPLKKWL